MVCFDQLNPTTITSIVVVDFARLEIEFKENMFGVGASIEESS
jgi:hypothetical protein